MGRVTLWSGVTATVAAPTLATDGAPLWRGPNGLIAPNGFLEDTDDVDFECQLVIAIVSGSGTLSIVDGRLWVLSVLSVLWLPLGTGADATKGEINESIDLGEVSSDKVVHTEPVRGLRTFDRVALSGTIGGTTPVLNAYLIRRG